MSNQQLQKIINNFIERATYVKIKSNIPFNAAQLQALFDLNYFCVCQVLKDTEVEKDTRKVFYKTNQELKTALVAICLSGAMTNASRRNKEKKEYFEQNISIEHHSDGVKFISFGSLDVNNVMEAIYPDIIEDWKVYRDSEGFGIQTLLDKKNNLTGLAGFDRGGDVVYEFARFQRKYTERENKKEAIARESAQNAFRNSIAETIAVEVAKQQLLQGANPMDLVDLLFSPSKNQNKIQNITKNKPKIDPQLEKDINLLLEYSPKD